MPPASCASTKASSTSRSCNSRCRTCSRSSTPPSPRHRESSNLPRYPGSPQVRLMFFLDSTGFFSLVSLLIQCILAWIVAGFLMLLGRRLQPSAWLRRWSTAFLLLAVGLSAITVRFLGAHHHVLGEPLTENHLLTRACYAIYFVGKVGFFWYLLGGARALRGQPWPTTWVRWTGPTVALLAALAAMLPSIESTLLVQAPLAITAFVLAARALRQGPSPEELGCRVAAATMLTWAAIWCAYAVTVIGVDPVHPRVDSSWSFLLRCNSLIDVVMQVTLGAALIVVVVQDVQRQALQAAAERDRLRAQVQRDERLRALSTLVSGVAHEINNPLTAILGFAADLDAADGPTRREAARIVLEQADRCRAIVQRLSVLGRQPVQTRDRIDADALVERVVAGLRPQFAQAGLTLRTTANAATTTLIGDAAGIEQVLTNLLVNALHASPRPGTVTVTTRTAADRWIVQIADQGRGVPLADRGRIFEPFFTTKPPGCGSGLGLPVAQAMVTAHGGTIQVGDADCGGAQFTVELPCAPAAAPMPAAPPAPAPPPHAADGSPLRLLIIDDEPQVRSSIERHARTAGWRTTATDSAESALPLLQTERFDALLCDLRMPGMAGSGLYDHLSRHAPDLLRRLVFVTGDLTSPDAAAFARRCRAPIVSKPFAFADLLRRLREVAVGA
ncbi:MAG: response regulator [Planctomycetes bacterium]|nr:response regulator [Planctomycetota bacterium]